MPKPKKPYFGSKRRKTKLANNKTTRRAHHGRGPRSAPLPKVARAPPCHSPQQRRHPPRGSAAAAHPVHGD
eukprot:2827315-Prymnesium_polylepis.1